MTESNNIKPNSPIEATPEKNKEIKGQISNWNAEKGFGFITLFDRRRVFCHVSELCTHLRPTRGASPKIGTKIVAKNILTTPKGLSAQEVQCEECTKPESWELKAIGKIARGVQGEVQELIPVSTKGTPTHRSPIPQEEIELANQAFLKAKTEEEIWEGKLNEKFFQIFGEPHSITETNDKKVKILYDYGIKETTLSDLFNCGHYNFKPSEEFKLDPVGNSSLVYLSVAYECLELPQIKHIQIIGSFGEKTMPHLNQQLFERLPQELKDRIVEELGKHIISASQLAEIELEKFEKSQTLTLFQTDKNTLLYFQYLSQGAYVKHEKAQILDSETEESWFSGESRTITSTINVLRTTIFFSATKLQNLPRFKHPMLQAKHSLIIDQAISPEPIRYYDNNEHKISEIKATSIEELLKKSSNYFEQEYSERIERILKPIIDNLKAKGKTALAPYFQEDFIEKFVLEFMKKFKQLEEEWVLIETNKIQKEINDSKRYLEMILKLEEAAKSIEDMHDYARTNIQKFEDFELEKIPGIYINIQSSYTTIDFETQFTPDLDQLEELEKRMREYIKTGYELIEKISQKETEARNTEILIQEIENLRSHIENISKEFKKCPFYSSIRKQIRGYEFYSSERKDQQLTKDAIPQLETIKEKLLEYLGKIQRLQNPTGDLDKLIALFTEEAYSRKARDPKDTLYLIEISNGQVCTLKNDGSMTPVEFSHTNRIPLKTHRYQTVYIDGNVLRIDNRSLQLQDGFYLINIDQNESYSVVMEENSPFGIKEMRQISLNDSTSPKPTPYIRQYEHLQPGPDDAIAVRRPRGSFIQQSESDCVEVRRQSTDTSRQSQSECVEVRRQSTYTSQQSESDCVEVRRQSTDTSRQSQSECIEVRRQRAPLLQQSEYEGAIAPRRHRTVENQSPTDFSRENPNPVIQEKDDSEKKKDSLKALLNKFNQ